MEWQSTKTPPADGRMVMTKIDDTNGCRNEGPLVKSGNLWFAGDMYVYYTPTHWRELTDLERRKIRNEEERKAIAKLEQLDHIL